MRTHRRALALALTLTLAGSGCASIWGFADGTLLDAGPDVILGDAGLDVIVDAPPSGDASDARASCPLTCMEAPPSGWDGPFAISEAMGGASPVSCGGAYPDEVYTGLGSPSAPDASCECTCAAPIGGSCAAPSLSLFSGAPCTAARSCATLDASTATCLNFDPACGGTHMEVNAPTAVPGACAATVLTALPDAGWATSARLCRVPAPTLGACDAGQTCAPAPGLPFESAYCIATATLAPCPPGPYSHQRLYYKGATDTRGCSPCACGTPSSSCSGGTVTTFNNAGCTPAHATWTLPQACANLGDKSAIYNVDAVFNPGTCSVSDGGGSTGSFTPTTPTTICCTQ